MNQNKIVNAKLSKKSHAFWYAIIGHQKSNVPSAADCSAVCWPIGHARAESYLMWVHKEPVPVPPCHHYRPLRFGIASNYAVLLVAERVTSLRDAKHTRTLAL